MISSLVGGVLRGDIRRMVSFLLFFYSLLGSADWMGDS